MKASTGEPNLVVSYRVDDSVQSVEAIESGIRLTVGGEHPVVVQLTAGAAGEEGANDGGSDKKTGAKFAVTDRVVTIAPSQITESPTSAVRWSWSIKAQ